MRQRPPRASVQAAPKREAVETKPLGSLRCLPPASELNSLDAKSKKASPCAIVTCW